MSAELLQRVVVRMLHDPELRAAVYAAPDAALADLALTPDERAMLTRPDARAWGVDVHRADRVLAALLSEHAVTALALLEDGVPLHRLHRFFQSAFFHDAIMTRRSLAPAFSDYLATLATTARTRSVLALEAAIARLRRAPEPVPDGSGRYQTSPRALPVELAAGTLASWDKARRALAGEPIAAVLVRPKRPRVGAVDARASEWVLLEQPGDEPLAGFTGEALGRLLMAAAAPVPRELLLEVIGREGADASEASEILDELVRDGLLRSL